MANEGNLIPFMKGENPLRYKKQKGDISFGAVARRFLAKEITIEEAGKKLKLTAKEAIILRQIGIAMSGGFKIEIIKDKVTGKVKKNIIAGEDSKDRTRAFEALRDTVEGKPKQPIENLDDKGLKNLSKEDLERLAKVKDIAGLKKFLAEKDKDECGD